MDKNNLNQNQQDTFNRVMNTQVGTSQPQTNNAPQPVPQQPIASNPMQQTTQSPFGANPAPAQPSGGATPFVANASVPQAAGKPAPVSSGGSSKVKLILFVVIGIILIAVYALVWAFVFGISIPFLPF